MLRGVDRAGSTSGSARWIAYGRARGGGNRRPEFGARSGGKEKNRTQVSRQERKAPDHKGENQTHSTERSVLSTIGAHEQPRP